MSTLAESPGEFKKPWHWLAAGAGILLIWSAVAFPALNRERTPSLASRAEPIAGFYSGAPTMTEPVPLAKMRGVAKEQAITGLAALPAAADRKIIRTSSLELVVRHPAEIADKIAAMAESLGGYLESSQGGGQDSTAVRLAIRVPSSTFEKARLAVRQLGVRVESEKIDAQDVTRQYVDQDASIRNLHAEEAQYLAILKQARTVKDMLAVTENLSTVRGQIEQQQAEFNALSRQVETVALTVSLRSETQEQTFGLNWKPGYQLRLALHDGLESLANYATTMIGILFFLPAMLLWTGTIMVVIVIGWRSIRWAGRHWLGWNEDGATAAR